MTGTFALEAQAAERPAALARRAELMRLVNTGWPRPGTRRRLAAGLRALAARVDERQPTADAAPGLRPHRAGGAC